MNMREANITLRPGEATRFGVLTVLDDQAHALLVSAFIRWLRRKPGVKTCCEVLYNHFGARGYVDVVAVFQPYPTGPWRGIACELKPQLLNLNETLRQIRQAERFFEWPTTLADVGQPILRFPLILEANEENFLTATHYAEILDGVEVCFFDVEKALDNPFEHAWQQRPTQAAADPRAVWQPPMGRNSFIYEGRAHLA